MIKKFNFILFIILIFSSKLLANENNYFLTLRSDKVNVRLGPAFEYPVKFVYKKKYFPLLIVEKSDVWRKVSDLNYNTGWIHISKLSKKKSAIVINDRTVLFKKPTKYSNPIATMAKGRLLLIKKCKKIWCKIVTDKYVGWVDKKNIWGNF